ncbi:MAG: hypothetical protein CM1200mP16_06540 [Nitrospina sp.]|nr:MAG: hypothetical protein CM1200mP16_06540 [Nitrospina sp.]
MHRLLVVQKYGGTSVGSLDRIRHVAKKSNRFEKLEPKLLLFFSAMAGETDKLVKMASKICDNPERREMDLLFLLEKEFQVHC